MSTTYRVLVDCCPHCSNPRDEFTIGTSAHGWHFRLRLYPKRDLTNADAWFSYLQQANVQIVDDCGRAITAEQLIDTITQRSRPNWPPDHMLRPIGYDSWEDFYRANHAARGQNNLFRSTDCTPSIGPWDYDTSHDDYATH